MAGNHSDRDHQAKSAEWKKRFSMPWAEEAQQISSAIYSALPEGELKTFARNLDAEKVRKGEAEALRHLDYAIAPKNSANGAGGTLTRSMGELMRRMLNPERFSGYDKGLPAWVVLNAIKKKCLWDDLTLDSKGRVFSKGVEIPPVDNFWMWRARHEAVEGTAYLKKVLGTDSRLAVQMEMSGSYISIEVPNKKDMETEPVIYTSLDYIDSGDTILASNLSTDRERVAAYKSKVNQIWTPSMDLDTSAQWHRKEFMPQAKDLNAVFGYLRERHGIVNVGQDFLEDSNGNRTAIPNIELIKVGENSDYGEPMTEYRPSIRGLRGEDLQAALVVKVFGRDLMK